MLESYSTTTSISIKTYSAAEQLPKTWDAVNHDRDLFLSRTYLHILEQFPPDRMRFRYVLLEQGDNAVGVFYFQWLPFHASESLSSEDVRESFIGRIEQTVKNWLAGQIKWNTLVLGNLLLTGEHHSLFEEELISADEIEKMLPDILGKVIDSLKEDGLSTDMILAKDFTSRNTWLPTEREADASFFPFTIRPNMIVDIDPSWKDEASYLADMQSKYRVRMRKARERKQGLQTKSLNLEQVHEVSDSLYALYTKIAERADFNLFYLHPEYFRALKDGLDENVHFQAYYREGEMVAFFSMIENGDQFIAHFVGYEPALLKTYDLYLNILLDMVVQTIALQKKRLIFARTATEIKSSVGAVSTQMYCFAQHRNRLAHRAMPILLHYLQPETEDNIRHPFKRSY